MHHENTEALRLAQRASVFATVHNCKPQRHGGTEKTTKWTSPDFVDTHLARYLRSSQEVCHERSEAAAVHRVVQSRSGPALDRGRADGGGRRAGARGPGGFAPQMEAGAARRGCGNGAGAGADRE